jgi:hypothetical protein
MAIEGAGIARPSPQRLRKGSASAVGPQLTTWPLREAGHLWPAEPLQDPFRYGTCERSEPNRWRSSDRCRASSRGPGGALRACGPEVHVPVLRGQVAFVLTRLAGLAL